MYDETEGNPFFVEEVYAHLNEERRLFDDSGEWRTDLSLETLDVPEGVRLVVGRRLERLDADGLKVLTAAAVLGRRFSYSVLEAAAGVEADRLLDAIEEAESLSLVESESASGSREARYHFAHELIRQTLLQGLSVPRRQRLHLRIAAVLEAKPDADERAATLSHHLYEAGAAADSDKTVHYLMLAARQAIETAAFEEALRRLDLVVDLVDESDDERWAEVCRLRGLSHRNLDHLEAAATEWERALEIYLRRRMLREGVDVAHELGWLYGFSAKTADAERVAHQALETLNPEGADRCILLADAAGIAGIAGRATAAASLVAEVETLSVLIDDGATQARVAFGVHGALVATGQIRAAQKAGARVLLTDAVSTYDQTSFLVNQAIVHALGGNWAGALACIAEGRPLAEQYGNWEASRTFGNVQAWSEFSTLADPAGALRLAEADLATSQERQIGYAAYTFLWMGLPHLWMGNLDQALEWAEQGAEKEIAEQCWYGTNQGLLLLCRGHGGDREGALALWARLADHLPAAVGVSPVGSWLLAGLAVEAWALLCERDLAASLYPALLHGVSLGLRATPTLPIETVVGIAAACDRQWTKAEEHFGRALQDCEDLPHRPGAAETRYWQAWALLEQGAAGNGDRVRTLLKDAVDRYQAIGMPMHEARARDLLARANA